MEINTHLVLFEKKNIYTILYIEEFRISIPGLSVIKIYLYIYNKIDKIKNYKKY